MPEFLTEQQAAERVDKPRRGRPPKKASVVDQVKQAAAKPDLLTQQQEQIAQLSNQLTNLTTCLGKIAHYSGGNIPRICEEFGIEVYQPTKADMHKRRG